MFRCRSCSGTLAASGRTPLKIALCICTRNRSEDLALALEAVMRSLVAPAQIIVSDDSDEAQAAQTQNFCASIASVTYVRGPKRGLSANRNCCLQNLDAEIEAVAYIDDDVLIRPEFLGEAAEALSQSAVKTIVTGSENKAGVIVTPHNCSFWGHQEVKPRDENDYHAIVINTTLFPRTLFQEAHFDEALRYGSEEADMCAQAEALGYNVRFFQRMTNDHYPSPVNRSEYSRFVEASRLYSTYKRYRWLERKVRKANMFALLAPVYLMASLVKARKFRHLASAFVSLKIALQYVLAEKKKRNANRHFLMLDELISC